MTHNGIIALHIVAAACRLPVEFFIICKTVISAVINTVHGGQLNSIKFFLAPYAALSGVIEYDVKVHFHSGSVECTYHLLKLFCGAACAFIA